MRINQRVRFGPYIGRVVYGLDDHEGWTRVMWDGSEPGTPSPWMRTDTLKIEAEICEYSVVPGMICEADGSVRFA